MAGENTKQHTITLYKGITQKRALSCTTSLSNRSIAIIRPGHRPATRACMEEGATRILRRGLLSTMDAAEHGYSPMTPCRWTPSLTKSSCGYAHAYRSCDYAYTWDYWSGLSRASLTAARQGTLRERSHCHGQRCPACPPRPPRHQQASQRSHRQAAGPHVPDCACGANQ